MAGKPKLKYTTVKNTFPGIGEWKRRVRTYGELAVRRSLEVARAGVVAETPVQTSRLVNSIQGNPQVQGDSIYEVVRKSEFNVVGSLGTNVPYARAVEFGIAEPQVITPKNKKALAFQGKDGNMVIVKKVVLPPRHGQFFFTRGWANKKEEIKQVTAATMLGK